MLTFSLHREIAGNEYLAVYDLLKLPATTSRVGFVEIPLAELDGEPYVEWAKAVVADEDDAFWDVQRIEEEVERLNASADTLTDDESDRLRADLADLLPVIEPARCWLHLRFPRD